MPLWVQSVPKNGADNSMSTHQKGLSRAIYLGGGHGNPLQYACLENPHGQRSLVDFSPWGRKELDTTEQLNTAQHYLA